MDLISFIFLVLFFVIISWYLTVPFFDMSWDNEYKNEDNNSELNQRKEILYSQLKELELDRKIDNISENDFIIERQNLKKEVSIILNKLKAK
tara:strand:+ start:369 stop:644 length:276 start_codon:yes stop_codon:yes gene_type:complete